MSRTERLTTPSVTRLIGMRLPLALGAIRPRPGLSPTSPHTAAGMRMEPPPSLACAIGTTPAATSAAAPPEEAPQE